MMKGLFGIGRLSNQMVIIDAYIIEELAERNKVLYDEGATAQLPCPHYDMDIDEAVAEDDKEESVIIIEL